LQTWTQYCVSSTVFAESIEQYTGLGFLNGILEYGGYRSDGGGTYAVINAWNSTGNSEIYLFSGTIFGLDDVCYMKMFNSTCMVAGGCGPSNIIYTNDGQNWTDECAPSNLNWNPQHPFTWGWSAEVVNGTAYVAEEPSDCLLSLSSDGGLMTWSGVGAATPFKYNMIMESIANELIGGCGGMWTENN
jgi:hypothetical protein